MLLLCVKIWDERKKLNISRLCKRRSNEVTGLNLMEIMNLQYFFFSSICISNIQLVKGGGFHCLSAAGRFELYLLAHRGLMCISKYDLSPLLRFYFSHFTAFLHLV